MTGIVFDITEASVHDGPGLRTTVFLKGCPMRCRWCHSPEGQSPQPETLYLPSGERLCGKVYEAGVLAAYLRKNAELLGSCGGITFSGGEPLMQGDFLLELLQSLRGIHTVIETSGCVDGGVFRSAANLVSRIHFGLKIVGEEEALYWTGCGTKQILENLRFLDGMENGPEYVFRIPLIAGAVTNERNLRDVETLCRSLKRLKEIEFLPANRMAPAKYCSCRRECDAVCRQTESGVLPAWFSPGVPFRILR